MMIAKHKDRIISLSVESIFYVVLFFIDVFIIKYFIGVSSWFYCILLAATIGSFVTWVITLVPDLIH